MEFGSTFFHNHFHGSQADSISPAFPCVTGALHDGRDVLATTAIGAMIKKPRASQVVIKAPMSRPSDHV